MRILLLGGTGAMGSHLSEILAIDKSHEIVITSRKQRESKDNVTFVTGNAHDDTFLDSLLKQKWDVIVDFMVYNTNEFGQRVNKILESCGQYIFLSSSRVYANSDSPISEGSDRLLDVSEDKDFLSTDEYALTKARQENILRANKNKNWTIIRPYITFAENRLQLGVLELQNWLYRALLGHTIVFSEDIASKYTTLTYGYDVARGIAAITGNKQASGRAFHITLSKPMKWREILNIYLDVIEKETGNRPKVKMLYSFPFVGGMNGKYQVIYDRRFDRRFDNSAISEFIDTSTFLSTEDGIKKSLTAFIHNNKNLDFHLNAFQEGAYDRLTGETMSLSKFKGIKEKVKYIMSRFFPFSLTFLRNIKISIR